MEVRPLGTADLDDYFAVRVQAFGMAGTEADRARWRAFVEAAPDAPILGAYDGRLLGALRVLPTGQHLAGRRVGTGAVAGVVVRPEARARCVARTLLGEALTWMRAAGIAASSLHPASTRVYRSAGWEIAGEAGHAAVPTRSLAAIPPREEQRVIPLGSDDEPALEAAYADWAPSVHGTLDRTGAFWGVHRVWAATDGSFTYGVRRGATVAGFVRYEQLAREGWGYRIRVGDLVAPDRATAAALWRFLGAHSMQVEQVEVPIVALPGLLLLLDEQDDVPVRANRWMHRIVDLPRYMTERGFAPGRHRIALRLMDPWAGGLAGTWRLEVADGEGRAVPVPDAEPAVTLDVGALSSLAIGGCTIGDLVAAGRVVGEPRDCAALAAMVAAPAPRISDEF